MVLISIGILTILFVAYVFTFPDQFNEKESQNLEQVSTEQIDATESWEKLEKLYFAEADEKGWLSVIIINSQGEEREYIKKDNQWVRKDTTTQTDNQITTQNSTQSAEYKKILVGKVIDAYSIFKTSLDYSEKIIPYMDERIDTLSSLISKNETLIEDINDSDFSTIVNNFNNSYKADNKLVGLYKDMLIINNKEAIKFMDIANADILLLNKDTYMSSDKFKEWNNIYEKVLGVANSNLASNKKTVSQFLSETKKMNEGYENNFALLKKIIDSESNNSYSDSSLVSYPKLATPPTIIPSITTTHCSFSMNPVGGGGNIHCSSY